MAAPNQSESAASTSEASEVNIVKNEDPELDFCSPNFNPQRALYSSATVVPFPRSSIKTFPNLTSYEHAVRSRREKKAEDKVEDSEYPEVKSETSASRSSSRSRTSTLKDRSKTSSTEDSRQGNRTKRETDRSRLSATARNETRTHDETSSRSASVSTRHAERRSGHEHHSHRSHSLSDYDRNRNVQKGHWKDDKLKAPPPKPKGKTHENEPPARLPEKPQPQHLSDKGEGSSTPQSLKKAKRNVFTRMEAMVGPLSLIKRCVEERLQVRVMTRRAVEVGSICKGYIVAFDKYMNLAMIDVDEIYRRPRVLGKVRSRRTHKMRAAKDTLLKEREEQTATWREEEEARLAEVSKASSSMQELSLVPDISLSSLKDILTAASKTGVDGGASTSRDADKDSSGTGPSTSKSKVSGKGKSDDPDDSLTSERAVTKFGDGSAYPPSVTFGRSILETNLSRAREHTKALESKFKDMKSVYQDLKAPFSPFEREALMLGVPDENVEIRHLNQLFIRGENLVFVNIVQEP
ncbi:uncharacterized protein LOC101863932 [Aplysia californica]|uniref:Uncharacterized protein LOC101863932 n=1 Tax=Aplysia californica TaxID=6500 RepID=A0ABM0K4G3_APLCA|nr:uncharacterized protein LOC101863932 [Aplysia californica]